MRKLIFIILLFLLTTSTVYGAMSYGASNYLVKRGYSLSGNTSYDPIYTFMNEVEGIIEDATLEGGSTITFDNGGTFDNATDNKFEWNENSDELIWTFGSNVVTVSSGDVTTFDYGTIVLKSDMVLLDPVASATATEGMIYYDSDTDKFFGRNASTWVDLTAGDAASDTSTLDDIYDNGSSIDCDTDPVTITVSNTDNNRALDVVQNDTTNNPVAMLVTNTGTGVSLDFASSGTYDIQGTSDAWAISAAGVGTFESLAFTTNGGTIANSTDTEIVFGENSEDFSIDFLSDEIDFKSSSGVATVGWGDLDDFTGLNNITFDASASIVSLTADSSGDDLSFKVLGSQDASLVLYSNGTGADAVQITSANGGIDITASGALATEDIDITATGSSINLSASEAVANQIKLSAAGTVAGEAILLTTTNGGISIDAGNSSNGDIDINPGDNVTIATGTAGSDTAIGNSTGDVAVTSDNFDVTCTDATDNVFQIIKAGGNPLFDIDLGGTDAMAWGDNSTTCAIDSSDWDISATGALSGIGAIGMDGGLTIANTTPPDIILENTTAGSDADSGKFYWRGEDHDTSTDLDMSMFLDVTTSTDYKLSFMDDGASAEVASIDQGGNIQMDGDLDCDGHINVPTDKYIGLGDGGSYGNITMAYETGSSDFKIDSIVADQVLWVGDSTSGFDMTWYFETAGTIATDYDGNSVTFDDVNLAMGDDDVVTFGDTPDVLIEFQEDDSDAFKINAVTTVAGDAILIETSDGGIHLNADGASNGDVNIDAADDILLTHVGQITVNGAATQIIVIEGTADDNEMTLSFTDPTADITYTFPDANAGTYGLVTSTLSTNGVHSANAIWGGTNQIILEGATANSFEIVITPTDPTADRTLTLPDRTGNVTVADTGTDIRTAVVEVSANEIKALAASQKTLVAAPGANYYLKFVSATLIMDVATQYDDAAADGDLYIKYDTGAGQAVTAAIEGDNLIDAAADAMSTAIAAEFDAVAASSLSNKALVLDNDGAEYTTGTGTMTVIVTYVVCADGL